MALTAIEQYAFELINRARLDPLAEAERYNLDLNANLSAGTITTDAKQVVSPNSILERAAEDHSIWMLDEDIFSHTGEGGSNPGDRMAAAGYEFIGRWSWRENLAWSGTTGSLSLASAIETHHEGLYRSEGHRVNTFGANSKELGLAQVEGRFTSNGTTFNASMLTLNYAASDIDVFLTGVAYSDTDDDAFYGIGEGLAGVTFAIDGTSQQTANAGGYGIAVDPDTYLVTVANGGSTLATLRVDLDGQNAKLDLRIAPDGTRWLDLSASAELESGISNARLLGVADLDLTGTDAGDVLIGNKGANILRGEGGNDELIGGAGSDALFGGAGNDILRGGEGRDGYWDDPDMAGLVSGNADTLDGGAGNDVLIGLSGMDILNGGAGDDILSGGGGRDTFIFDGGDDVITDFAIGVDTLTIDLDALGASGMTQAELLSSATASGGDLTIYVGDHSLTLNGISSGAAMTDEFVFA